MGTIKNFFRERIFGLPSKIGRELIVELPSEEEKRKTQQIRLQNEKIRDLSIENRLIKKELVKKEKKEKKTKEEKELIKEVLKKAKNIKKEKTKTKAVYKLIYPKKPFIQYANGKRRLYDGFEINETKEGTPLFRLRFYSPEAKSVVPLQLDAQELTFFFKNIIGLSTQHNTGIIPLNVDEIEGKPVFINSEIDFIKSKEVMIARLVRDTARKDDEIRRLRGKMGTTQEIQAEQEKDLADRDMALRYSQKDSENKAAKLERVMGINLEVADKLREDHIGKQMSELKMAQSIRTLQAYEINNANLNQKLTEAYSSDAYDLGKQDVLELMDKITKNILSVQSATKVITSPQIKTIVKEPVKEIKK